MTTNATKNKSNAAPKKRATKSKVLPDGPDWTFDILEQYHTEIKRVAEFYKLYLRSCHSTSF